MLSPKPVRTKVTKGSPTIVRINVGKNHPNMKRHGSPSGQTPLLD